MDAGQSENRETFAAYLAQYYVATKGYNARCRKRPHSRMPATSS